MFLFALNVVIAINTCLASILATNLETQFVQVSSPFPFSMLFLTPKCFTLINIERANGMFQGIVIEVVAILDS